jgi:hypothetical protein
LLIGAAAAKAASVIRLIEKRIVYVSKVVISMSVNFSSLSKVNTSGGVTVQI